MKIDDVKVILFDIDDTITTFKGDYGVHDYVDDIFSIFASALAEKTGIVVSEARRKIDSYADNLVWWDYPDFIADFDLPALPVWKAMRQIHQKHLSVFDDAVEMIKSFHQEGRTMHVISNNPVTGCLLKLEVAGLANLNGCKYFSRIFGTNVTRGMKSQLPMWKRVVASLGVLPSEILTIGDSVKEDFEIPQTAGIEHTVIINRALNAAIEKRDGYFVVNNLSNLTSLV